MLEQKVNGTALHLLAPAAALGLLAWSVVTDLRERRIPNEIPGSIAVLWLAQHGLAEGSVPPWSAAAGAVAVLLAASLLWRLGWLGGGDVKLLAALSLWAEGGGLVSFLLLTALLGGALALLWLRLLPVAVLLPPMLADAVRGAPAAEGSRVTLPYGLAIALAGAWLIHQRYWS